MNPQLNMEIREALDNGLDYINRVHKNLGLLTDALERKDEKSITSNYNDLKEGLEWLFDILRSIGALLQLNYSEILISKQSVDKIINNYMKLLTQIDELHNKDEYAEVSIIVKDELPKHLKKITSIFNKINTIMNGKEN